MVGGSQVKRFDIVFDSPSGAFYAGRVVSGKVIVDLTETMKIRAIKLRWIGETSVYFQDTKSKKRVSETEKYFDDTVILYGSADTSLLGQTTLLNSGRLELPFSFTPPPSVPSSFESAFGHVRYLCKATVHRPWAFNVNTKKAFTLVSILDLNSEPYAFTPGYAYISKRFSKFDQIFACVRGGLAVTVKTDRRAFVPGERMLVNAEISNYSSKRVKGVEAFLLQNITYTSTSGGNCVCLGNTKIGHIKQGSVECGDVQIWHQEPFTIPALPPTKLGNCRLINVEYMFKIVVDVDNSPKIVLSIPMVIGTIPLHQLAINQLAIEQSSSRSAAQPSAPPMPDELPDEPGLPTYEECFYMDQGNIEDEDGGQMFGDRTYRPLYPTYATAPGPFPPPVLSPSTQPVACKY